MLTCVIHLSILEDVAKEHTAGFHLVTPPPPPFYIFEIVHSTTIETSQHKQKLLPPLSLGYCNFNPHFP